MKPAAIVIDKVKWDQVKVRIEYQRERPDDRFDEAAIASFDRPMPSFAAALQALVGDLCRICELHESYAIGLLIRGVSFTYSEDSSGVMGVVITGLKSVRTAKAPVVINTPFLNEGPLNDGDTGPFLEAGTIERLHSLRDEAERYINGEREQPSLLPPAPPTDEDRSGALFDQIAERLTDPDNPIVQDLAKKLTNTSIIAGGHRLDIDGAGNITSGPDTPKENT